jgi:two-component system, OmpR family, sensor histidine kinase SenX3
MDFSTLLASTIHDMKNSIGLLNNALDGMASECSLNECKSAAQLPYLRYEANRLNGNLLQLLTLYKIDKSNIALNIANHNVFDFLEENILGNVPLLDSKGITVELECPEDLVWFFDRELLSGIVNNLLNNAYKYAGDRLKISACVEAAGLAVKIEDNGKGYPDSLTASSLGPDRFVNFHSGSTGLGLYFASLIAVMHKNGGREGSVAISNGGALGGGCFSIFLP